MSNSEIVITGMGVVCPIGIGLEPFWASLCEGRSGVRLLSLFNDPDIFVPFGGQVADFDPKQYVRPRKSLKVMNRDIQLGFTASDMAYASSGLQNHAIAPERLGVLHGADLMPCDLDELYIVYRNCLVDGKFQYDRWGKSFPSDMFPLWMLKYLPNMPACHIGIAQDARGPNNTITLGEVSTLTAFHGALHAIERGQADAMIAGGVSSRIHHALWPRNQIFGRSQQASNPAAASRPFDARRDGVVPGEAAAAVVLEKATIAQTRGAKVFAKVRSCAAGFEPHAKGKPLQGTAIRRVILSAIESAGLKPSDIGFVTAHGTSHVISDRIEAHAIRETLGDVPVTAPKSYFGHAGAASGAVELVFTALALQHGQIPPTLNYEYPDPECPVNVVHGQPMPLSRPFAVVLSHSRQGQALAVVLEGVERY
jgi:3-oxoacyl-[acyl-carrier-protein] synthase II